MKNKTKNVSDYVQETVTGRPLSMPKRKPVKTATKSVGFGPRGAGYPFGAPFQVTRTSGASKGSIGSKY